jgi:biopolymer transport protein ExbB/TolQ
MLGSVANSATLDVNTMQKILRQMSSGMGTALFTTLAGLIGSILLGMQYLLLDKGADDLLQRVIRVAEIEIKPKLAIGRSD